jgi:hypothetical protein
MAFARKKQLCYSSLRRWKKRLSPASPQAPPRVPGFVRVQLQGEDSLGEYVLDLPRGGSLRIPGGFQSDSLLRLLGVLKEWI